ncbi:hypothetical protein GXW82_02355 [Streptacidiphilus sp. 4-A2]|nr:hypothetical protein [Streptacidiphilus sp. 4-A2]
MDVAQAKQAVSDLKAAQPSFAGPDVARANTLIDQPDAMNQGFYGTCGMAAVVRSFLQYDRARFVELLRAVYAGTDFNGIATGPGVLLDGRLKQRDAKAVQFDTAYVPLFDLDFVLTRSLGKLLKIRSPEMLRRAGAVLGGDRPAVQREGALPGRVHARPEHIATLDAARLDAELSGDLKLKGWRLGEVAGFTVDLSTVNIEAKVPGDQWQLRFSAGGRDRVLRILRTAAGPLQVAVDVRASESAFRDQGDLGLDADGLRALLLDVAGAPTATITHLTPATPQAAVDTVNAQLAGPNPYVYAFIRSFDDWTAANVSAAARTFPNPPTPPAPIWGRVEPEGEHIIAVNGPIRKEATAYVLPVWTWRNAFEVRIEATHLAGYVPVLVHGSISN